MSGISDIALIRGEPIERYGLTFYPLTMEHYEEWNACKGALTLRMSTLPALYGVMPYLGALYAMDMDAMMAEKQSAGWMGRLAALLCLSLRLPKESPEQFIGFMCDPKEPRKLTQIVLFDGQTKAHISVMDFNEIREVIALQNGAELPDESENPELIQAKTDRNTAGMQLEYSFENLIAAVAYQSHVDEKDVLNWTIRAFQARQRAIARDKQYMINGIIEGSGMVKWKGGNPVISWCFDKTEAADGGFMSESEMLGSLGKVGTIK